MVVRDVRTLHLAAKHSQDVVSQTARWPVNSRPPRWSLTAMQKTMRLKFIPLFALLCLLFPQIAASQSSAKEFAGRWQVKFTFAGRNEMNLVFEAQAKGVGNFLLLDTAADSKPEAAPRAAAWLATTNDRVGISGEVELPIGDCCREAGTLILKGTPGPNNSLAGRVVFIASTTDEENGVGFRTMVGTFTATRIPAGK